jgi:hypothetical protein
VADIEHAVQLIDQTLTAILPHCHQCNTVLRRHGPSLDFCGDLCQTAWHQKRAVALPAAPRPYIREVDDRFLSLKAYRTRRWRKR